MTKQLIKNLFSASLDLEKEFPDRNFWPSGQQLGNLGEVLLAKAFDLKLATPMTKEVDAYTQDGTPVQIKAITSRAIGVNISKQRPDEQKHLLAVLINPDGTFEVIYNGPEIVAWEAKQKSKAFVSMGPFIRAAKSIPEPQKLKRIDQPCCIERG